jgi:hypothetical protein
MVRSRRRNRYRNSRSDEPALVDRPRRNGRPHMRLSTTCPEIGSPKVLEQVTDDVEIADHYRASRNEFHSPMKQ